MAKMGRPKADCPRNKNINFRLTSQDYDKLKEYAANRNLTMTEIISEAINQLYENDKDNSN